MSKKQAFLQKHRLINLLPERVKCKLFHENEFFDPLDKMQVKYEMLRVHSVEGRNVKAAAEEFGMSRQSFYDTAKTFEEEGMAGLAGKKRGRKGPQKCTSEVVSLLLDRKEKEPDLSGSQLAEWLREEKAIDLHRRTVEKIISGRGAGKKKVQAKKKRGR